METTERHNKAETDVIISTGVSESSPPGIQIQDRRVEDNSYREHKDNAAKQVLHENNVNNQVDGGLKDDVDVYEKTVYSPQTQLYNDMMRDSRNKTITSMNVNIFAITLFPSGNVH